MLKFQSDRRINDINHYVIAQSTGYIACALSFCNLKKFTGRPLVDSKTKVTDKAKQYFTNCEVKH